MHIVKARHLILGCALIALVAVGLALLSGLGGERNTAEAGGAPVGPYYLCYRAPDVFSQVDPPTVSLNTQFEALSVDPSSGGLFCAPALKDGPGD